MSVRRAQDLSDLATALPSILGANGFPRRRLTATHRESTPYVTTFPCEIVTCRFDDGQKVRLFCKYGCKNRSCSHGQRGGVAYEAEVYRRVLQRSAGSAPAFYGSHTDRTTGGTWLILEYLPRSRRIGKVHGLRAMNLAARWIGEFHAANEAPAARGSVSFLTTYDAAYYRGWPRRASRFARSFLKRFPWVPTLCQRLTNQISSLARLPQTVIHGEYYPHNIMFQAGTVRPVDWETAAIAPGEIDLATLGDGWPSRVVRQLELEYKRARWPNGPPPDFQRNVDVARVYVHLRWLGDREEWADDSNRWKQLHAVSKRLGLI